MTEQMLRAKAVDIFNMNEYELQEFGEKVSMSEIDDRSKLYFYTAIEDRQMQLLAHEEMEGASVVPSELREGELL